MLNLFAFRGSPEFVTDGCSGYLTWAWQKLTGDVPPWNGVCERHDRVYWSAAADGDRSLADLMLYEGIVKSGHPIWAWLCWLAVRPGGSQYLPFSWRWRYKENYFAVVLGLR